MKHLLVELEDGQSTILELADVEYGQSLAQLLAKHGLPLNMRCAGRRLCHGCEVSLRGTLTKACQVQLTEDITTISLPERSRLEHRAQVSDTFRIDIPYTENPLFSPRAQGQDTAFAVDIGTTTVAVLLIDLPSATVIARIGGFNDQIRFGDNVLTRIDVARNADRLLAMQRAVVNNTIAPLLQRACNESGRDPSRLAGGTIAGNTTMLHLLLAEDPTSMGVAPFTPRFLEARRITAAAIGLDIHSTEVPIQLLPGIAAYVGADITAGVHATGMLFDTEPSLLIDIGTNGEMVLQSNGRLIGCATAAGPAFEGSGLHSGIRARHGAISHLNVSLNPFRLEAETIGQVPLAKAVGICGSAYVDFLATARHCGLLLNSGRFNEEQWRQLPEYHRIETAHGKMLCLSGSGGSGDICISEVDVATLLQAKAAIGAGLETLLAITQIKAESISRVYLAGGFGMFLNPRHAIDVGLLPHFQVEQIQVVGNTALAGALVALLDRTALQEMQSWCPRVQVLELNLEEKFEDRFIDHLWLP